MIFQGIVINVVFAESLFPHAALSIQFLTEFFHFAHVFRHRVEVPLKVMLAQRNSNGGLETVHFESFDGFIELSLELGDLDSFCELFF